MNKYLKSAVERYQSYIEKLKPGGFLINPISKIDVEIFEEIRIILTKLFQNDVVEILKNYKEFKDEEVRDSLLQWNIDNPSFEKGKDSREKDKPVFFELNGLFLREYHLIGIELFEQVSTEEPYEVEFCIKLNPTPEEASKIPFYSNYIVKYRDEEEREEVIDRLKSYLNERNFSIVRL